MEFFRVEKLQTKKQIVMKKFFKYAAMAAIAAMFASCEEPAPTPEPEPETPKVEITEDLTFTLEVTEVEAELAKVKVEHNGTTKDTWYAFATTETNVNTAITAKVAELTADGSVSGLKKSRSTTVTVRSLEQDTDYTFIVFGITAEGQLYGTAASTTFKTAKAELKYTENAAWTVEYKGAGVIDDEPYDHTVTVTSTDNNAYFVTAYPVAEFEQYGIKAIAEAEFNYFVEYINAFNAQYGTNYTVLDGFCWVGTATDAVYVEAGVDYYAFAIGVGEDGQLNGLWAKSDVINVAEDDLDAAYADWIGDWIFTGANGVAWPITFQKGVANESFLMSGWEGDAAAGLDVEVLWDPENEIWAAMIQNLGTYEFQGGQTGDIWFTAFDAEGYFYPVEDIPAFIGGYDEGGNRLAIGYTPEDGNGNTIEFVQAGYIASIGDQWYGITGTEEFPSYPITITPASETRAAADDNKNFAGINKIKRQFNVFPTDWQLR